MRIAVTGASGFLGGHMCARLAADGHEVIALGRRPLPNWWQDPRDIGVAVWHTRTLYGPDAFYTRRGNNILDGCERLYHFACDMGGRGFTDGDHDVACAKNAVIDLNVLRAASEAGVKRLFYASSACVYPTSEQRPWGWTPLREDMAGPPWQPDGVYGLAKLYGEQACRAYARERELGLEVRIGRYHGVFGPYGAWDGPRAKAPAALMRKALVNAETGAPIEIWGDGSQRRSYLYVDDAVEATIRVMESDYGGPLNIGSEELLSVATMAKIIAVNAARPDAILLRVAGPEGPHSRACDSTLIREKTGWRQTISFLQGVQQTLPWIREQLEAARERVDAS